MKKIEINTLQYKEYSPELNIIDMSGNTSESSSSSSNVGTGITIDIRPMIEDVSQVMTKHITNILSGVIGEYTIYKETHDTIMGLPCVRKLQQRITELENGRGGEETATTATPIPTTLSTCASKTNSREDEIAQLQSAIIDLNRYIHALEKSNNAKKAADEPNSIQNETNREEEEESVKLEIHENDGHVDGDEQPLDDQCVDSSTIHKTENIIVSPDELKEEDAEDEEAEEEEEEEADAQQEQAEEEEEEEEEEDEEEVDAEEEQADVEDANAEAEEETEEEPAEVDDTNAAEAEEDAKDADAQDANADEEEAEEEEAEEEEADAEEDEEEEEAEIEVSEVNIKGKTYFTTDAVNGIIYACVNDDVGDEVGVFKNGVAVFNKGKK